MAGVGMLPQIPLVPELSSAFGICTTQLGFLVLAILTFYNLFAPSESLNTQIAKTICVSIFFLEIFISFFVFFVTIFISFFFLLFYCLSVFSFFFLVMFIYFFLMKMFIFSIIINLKIISQIINQTFFKIYVIIILNGKFCLGVLQCYSYI